MSAWGSDKLWQWIQNGSWHVRDCVHRALTETQWILIPTLADDTSGKVTQLGGRALLLPCGWYWINWASARDRCSYRLWVHTTNDDIRRWLDYVKATHPCSKLNQLNYNPNHRSYAFTLLWTYHLHLNVKLNKMQIPNVHKYLFNFQYLAGNIAFSEV